MQSLLLRKLINEVGFNFVIVYLNLSDNEISLLLTLSYNRNDYG